MLFYDRSDGRRVRSLRAFNAILPYVVRKRNEAAVLMSKDIDVETAVSYIRRKNVELEAARGLRPEAERYTQVAEGDLNNNFPSVLASEAKRYTQVAEGDFNNNFPSVLASEAKRYTQGAEGDFNNNFPSVLASEAKRYSLFGLLIAAAVRTIALKPRLNRFVHGRAIYQRKGISVSFIVKKALTEAAGEGAAKIAFEPLDRIGEAMEKIGSGIEAARGGVPGPDDREFDFWHRIPLGKAAATLVFGLLDRFNVAPARMIAVDPLFTSIYVANLGSIGLDAPYHHLYEWGSSSIFMVIGRMFQKETYKSSGMELRHFVNVKFTIDERIAEGIYFAHAAALFQRLVSKPETLETSPDLSQAEA